MPHHSHTNHFIWCGGNGASGVIKWWNENVKTNDSNNDDERIAENHKENAEKSQQCLPFRVVL